MPIKQERELRALIKSWKNSKQFKAIFPFYCLTILLNFIMGSDMKVEIRAHYFGECFAGETHL